MKKCIYCNQEYEDKIQFCRTCGQRLVRLTRIRQNLSLKPTILGILLFFACLIIIVQYAGLKRIQQPPVKIESPKTHLPPAEPPAPFSEPDLFPLLQHAPSPDATPTPKSDDDSVPAYELSNRALMHCPGKTCPDPHKAIQYLNSAIKLKPDFAEAYNNRGGAYMNLDQPARAIDDFNEAIRLKPDLAEAYSNRGSAYRALNQPERAIDDYSEAIRLKPVYAEAYTYRGDAYLSQGKKEEGCADLQKACAFGYCPTWENARNRGICH